MKEAQVTFSSESLVPSGRGGGQSLRFLVKIEVDENELDEIFAKYPVWEVVKLRGEPNGDRKLRR